MPQIIVKERTAHLATYKFFTRDVDQYKITSISLLYQPPRTRFSLNPYQSLLLSCEYFKVFKKGLFREHLQKQLFTDVLQNRYA